MSRKMDRFRAARDRIQQMNADAHLAYDLGFQAGREEALAAWPGPRNPQDERLRRLDEAEHQGEVEYAAERKRQGLIPYDRHKGLA